MADHGLGAQAHRVGAGEVRRGIGLDVEQVGDAERRPSAGSSGSQLRGDPSGPPLAGGCGVHGVLDDPPVIGGPGALAGRVQLHEVAAVGEHPSRGRREGPRRTPRPATGCARRWRALAGQGVGLEVAVGQQQHPRPERRQQVSCQGCFTERAGPEGGPDQRPGPRLRRGEPADLQKRPGPGRVRGSAEVRGVLRGVRHVAGGAVHRHPRSPQQNTPAAPTGPALESKGTDTRRVAARSTPCRSRSRSRASLACGRHRRPHAVPAARLAATRAGGLIPILRVLSAFVMSRASIRPFPVRSGAVC